MVNSISKDQIKDLPIVRFTGEITLVENEEDAEKAVKYLSVFDKIGFDTETRPAFRKGQSNKIALMQLSTKDVCFLFRLNIIGLPDCLLQLLANPQIKKIGLSLKDDFSAIRKSASFTPQGFIELQSYVKLFGIEDIGLQRIYAILFGMKISKNQRLTNWESKELTDSQKMYASIDAWACLMIYNELERTKSAKIILK